ICLGTVTENDIVRHLPCGHTFHSDYITPWYRTHHDTCPICTMLALPELVHYDLDGSMYEIIRSKEVLGLFFNISSLPLSTWNITTNCE
ncbi:hypothetical protein BKA60DRAFT_475217, partial [Fusarium oxysporum]